MIKRSIKLSRDWWVIFLVIFSLASLITEILSGKWSMFDFEVYYRTAERMLTGDEIYRIPSDDFYVYKYAPTFGILFIPFTVLPLWLSKILFWLVSTLLLGVVLQKLFEQIGHEQLNKNLLLPFTIFISLLTVLIHIHSELTIGQVNILLLFIYVYVLFSIKNNKQLFAALLLSVSLFIKPFGLIFLPYLFLKKKYKPLLYIPGIIILLFVLPFIFYPTFHSFISLYDAWMKELGIELGNKQELLAPANHTIFSVLARLTPIGLFLKSSVLQKIYQLLVIFAIGWLFYRLERRKQSIILEMSILIILMPLFAATSKNAFIFAMPLAMYMISHFKVSSTPVKILTALGCALIGGNLYEIYGPELSMFLTEISIYSVGSILLLIASFIYSKQLYLKNFQVKQTC